MEIASASFETAQRLMQALENSRLSEGAGLASETRSPPPDDLVKEFRALMERPDTTSDVAAVQSPVNTETRVNEVQLQAQPTDAVEGIQVDTASLMSPNELYGIQFATRMLVYSARFFETAQRTTTSQFEQMLKTQS